MSISEFWNRAESFRGSDAAYLMLGLEPIRSQVAPLAAHAILVRRLEVSYVDTCALLRLSLERRLEWGALPTSLLEREAQDLIFLPSLELTMVLDQYESAKSKSELELFREIGLQWLDEALDSFDRQLFSKGELANWLYWSDIPSQFHFGDKPPQDPSARRAWVKEMLAEEGGNKSAVARRLGVSRQRVDQLVRPTSDRKRKALRFVANDPFSMGTRSKKTDPESTED